MTILIITCILQYVFISALITIIGGFNLKYVPDLLRVVFWPITIWFL